MGMATGSIARKSRATPQMNVTPLVDVVLVLLIIFMVVAPLLSKQMWLQLPKQDAQLAEPSSENKSVVLTVKTDGTLAVNGTDLPKSELKDKMRRVMAARSDKVIYFDAADDAPYSATVEAIDLARQAGAKTVAILTQKIAQ